MHFLNLVTVLGLAAFAAASPQDPQTSTSISTISGSELATVTTPAAPTSSVTMCISSCAATDICCQAACVGVPCPNEAQVDATTECAMKCNQGNGSAAETEEYGKCQSSCINSLFLSTATVAATGTNERSSSNSLSATRSRSSDAGSESSPTSSSDAAASASSTGNAANSIQIGASTAGILGLVMAALAL